MTTRHVARVVRSQPTSDGAGVRLNRTIGTFHLDHVDPFLLLDEFRSDQASDYIAGFPDHPHRGFETVTYMLAGAMRHRDHTGAEGHLHAGSIQWMTAGRGIIHSEMPEQEDGLMWGFQLWVNLPAKDKMKPARYQDIPPEAVPRVQLGGGGEVRVLAGQAHGATGPVKEVVTAPLYLDLRLPAGVTAEEPIPAGHTAFVYVYEGRIRVADTEIEAGHLAVLSDGDAALLSAPDDSAGRGLLVAAAPLGEPVARMGPFVMNTQEELRQAVLDFRTGRLTG